MKHLINRILYWLSWPLATIYINGSNRTRLLITCGDQVLVMQDWVSDGQWGLPGGGLHKNEDPMSGVIREVHEEIGLKLEPKDIRFLGTKPFKHKGFSYNCHYFYSNLTELKPVQPHLEVMQVNWVNRDSLDNLNTRPDVLTALTLVRGS